MRWHHSLTSVAALSFGLAGAASGQSSSLDGLLMYGINRDFGLLSRYDFAAHSVEHVNVISVDGVTYQAAGIDGGAYIPGFQNIYAFWRDPADSQTKLLYVDTETAQAAIIGQPMGYGKVTGATAALITGNPQWLNPNTDLLPISGEIDINPNNSPDNEFTLTLDDGQFINRDDLHAQTSVDANGYYTHQNSTFMKATNVRFKCKGSGEQEMLIGGQTYVMHNSITYLLTGSFTVRIWNDYIDSHNKAMGHWHMIITEGDIEVVNGEAADKGVDSGDSWLVFALQNVENEEDDTIDFEIDGDTVVPSEPFAIKVSILGAAISYGGDYDIPVTTRVMLDGASHDLFGDYNLALDGNVNDAYNPRHYIFNTTYPAGTAVSILGRSWVKTSSKKSGTNENHWTTYLTVDGASSDSQQLIVLRHGDPVPDIQGYLDQGNVVDFVRDYIDTTTNTIVLDENQAIFLYELGTTNMSSSAADFQDLVVLVTLDTSAANLEDDDDDDAVIGTAARLLKVDHKTGGYQQIMTLDNKYDSLAWLNGNVFYAVKSNELWKLDPEAQTETLVDPVTHDNYYGLEFAGQQLMGFEIDADVLRAIDHVAGTDSDATTSTGMTNLGTIIFMPKEVDPTQTADAFD